MRSHKLSILYIFAACILALCSIIAFQEIAPAKAHAQRVYIDAGHGGSDSGAVGSGYREADLTAELARAVGDSLSRNYPYVNYYINTSGNHYTVRGQDAADRGCDSFVSIHFNSASSSAAIK